MIRRLRAVLGPQEQRSYTDFLVWVSIYGVLQGISVSTLVPIASALVSGDRQGAWRWIAVLAGCALATAVAHYVQAMKGFNVALTVLRTMHLNIGDHLVTLPLGWFSGKVGSVAQIAAKGTLAVGSAAAHLMTPLVTAISAPATIAVCMLFLDWRIGLVLIGCAPLIYLSGRISGWYVARREERTHQATAATSDRVIEFARCQSVLRATGRTQESYRPLEEAISAQQRANRAGLRDAILGQLIHGVTVQFTFALTIVVAAALALNGRLSGVELLALLGVAARFVQPLLEIGEFGGAVRLADGELTRIDTIMKTEPLPEPGQARAVQRPGEVELDDVHFGYEPGEPVLNGVSLTARPGSMTALVGASGSGKTTISRLIARFYDIDSGAVRVGGVDVRDQRTEDLMSQLALVFQDVYLFDDTLWENIRVGNRDATDAEIEDAARLAGVSEIAERLPLGWQTPVGEAGSALSGGERQRVSIARAILKNAPVLLLDEATAALDPENERFVQATMDTLRRHTTLIVIAHRLSTVVAADQILVLDAGEIVERGEHTELLSAGGRYAAFWNQRRQAAGWRLLSRPTP